MLHVEPFAVTYPDNVRNELYAMIHFESERKMHGGAEDQRVFDPCTRGMMVLVHLDNGSADSV